MKSWIFALALLILPFQAYAEVQTSAVEYVHDEAQLEGYLAYDDALNTKRPGVIVVHEWKGLGDYAKRRARELAALGYVAFAVDMYGKGIYAQDHKEAGALSGIYRRDRALMRERVRAGLDVLLKQEWVDQSRIAAIGYCFGGSTVLEMARAGFDLSGVVSFHGGLGTPTPAAPGTVKAKVLVLHGADDPHESVESVQAFQDEMRAAQANWQFVSFGGAVHGFTAPHAGDDPSKGVAYNADADKRSWEMMKSFFNEIFGG